MTKTKLNTHSIDARAPLQVADRATCRYAAYNNSTTNVTMYLGSEYELCPGNRSTAKNPSPVPTAMVIRPTRTLVWLIRSSNSRGGNLHKMSPSLRMRRSRSSARYIRLSTQESANAAYASMLSVTCNANTTPCACVGVPG